MDSRARKKLRVLVVADKELLPPESIEGLTDKQRQYMENELDVISTLKEMGHEIQTVGVKGDIRVIRKAIDEFSPHVAFNLLVELHGNVLYEPYVVSYLELHRQPYTGCNPRGIMLAQDKALTKKILAFHRILVPDFAVFPLNRKVRRPTSLKFPLLVKSLREHGSTGISQASIVNSDEALAERVEFIHRQTKNHAIADQYIEGRELYVAVLGNTRLQTFAPWELLIENLPAGAAYIATSKIKWDRSYQKKVGLSTRPAEVSDELKTRIEYLSKRIYRALHLSGYARLDYRMNAEGELYLLEANPNPDISHGEDFAEAAEHSKLSYDTLLQKILQLGVTYQPTF